MGEEVKGTLWSWYVEQELAVRYLEILREAQRSLSKHIRRHTLRARVGVCVFKKTSMRVVPRESDVVPSRNM